MSPPQGPFSGYLGHVGGVSGVVTVHVHTLTCCPQLAVASFPFFSAGHQPLLAPSGCHTHAATSSPPSYSLVCACPPAGPPFVPALLSWIAVGRRQMHRAPCFPVGRDGGLWGRPTVFPFIDRVPERLGPCQTLLASETKIRSSVSASQGQVHEACLEHRMSGHLYSPDNVLLRGFLMLMCWLGKEPCEPQSGGK